MGATHLLPENYTTAVNIAASVLPNMPLGVFADGTANVTAAPV
jgi:hypothetical protein